MQPRFDHYQPLREKAEAMEELRVLKSESEGKFDLMIWRPRAFRPFINVRFSKEANREEYLAARIREHQTSENAKIERKEKMKATPEKLAMIQIGDIFYSSWGWEQTNVDFYQVVEKKGSSVCLKKIKRTLTENGTGNGMAGHVLPCKDEFSGETFSKKVLFYNDSPRLKLSSYSDAYPWDGKEKYCSWYA